MLGGMIRLSYSDLSLRRACLSRCERHGAKRRWPSYSLEGLVRRASSCVCVFGVNIERGRGNGEKKIEKRKRESKKERKKEIEMGH